MDRRWGLLAPAAWPPPTYSAAKWKEGDRCFGPGKSRIDVILVNLAALSCLAGYGERFDLARDTIHHVPLQAELGFQKLRLQGYRAVVPGPIDLTGV